MSRKSIASFAFAMASVANPVQAQICTPFTDVSAKTDFVTVDGSEVLEKVSRLPITTWRYREGEGPVRHIGPMAEDFHAAFGVGYGPHTIADLDARGVALAAIQGLNAKLEAQKLALERELEAQRRELAELRRTVAGLLARSVAGDRAAQSAVNDSDRLAAHSP